MTYIDYCKTTLRRVGLNPKEYTDEQIVIIAQPIEAPEDYAHDGELTPFEQKENWLNKLKKVGLTPLQRVKISEIILG